MTDVAPKWIRVNLDNIELSDVKSSIMKKTWYSEGNMYVEFNWWKKYQYRDVPNFEYRNMLESTSVWSYFKKNFQSYKYDVIDESEWTTE